MLCDNQGLKLLVFAYHHDMMNGISEEIHDNKIKFIRIDGSTPPMDRPVNEMLLKSQIKSQILYYVVKH